MILTKSEEGRICNNCSNRNEDRLFTIGMRESTTLPLQICLCVNCLDELKGLIGELELFK